jgi:hypothetical protein
MVKYQKSRGVDEWFWKKEEFYQITIVGSKPT